MFTFRLNWEDEHTGELSGTVIFIDDNGDWRGYNDRELIHYLWESDVFCYNEISEGPKRAQSLGIFSHMERE
jgi:hypothetical protein